jgi:hypothetical protein
MPLPRTFIHFTDFIHSFDPLTNSRELSKFYLIECGHLAKTELCGHMAKTSELGHSVCTDAVRFHGVMTHCGSYTGLTSKPATHAIFDHVSHLL